MFDRSYDPITDEWTEPIQGVILPHEREKHNMVSVGRRVVVIGGKLFINDTILKSKQKKKNKIIAFENINAITFICHLRQTFETRQKRNNFKEQNKYPSS